MNKKRSSITIATISAAAIIHMLFSGCAVAPPGAENESGMKKGAAQEEEARRGMTPEMMMLQANQSAQDGDYAGASSLLDDLLAKEPDNLEALRLLAKVEAAAGNPARSSEVWERIYALSPADPDAAYETASKLADRKDWPGVRDRMMTVEASGKADRRHHLLLGRADMELRHRQEAEKYLKKASGLELADALLGELYYSSGKTSLAEASFEKALAANPDNFTANLHLGYIAFSRGNMSKARRYYEKAHALDPHDALACLSLASLYEKIALESKAIELYSRALHLSGTPRSEKKKVYISLSRLLVKNGEFDRAIGEIKDGLALFPGSGGLYFYWGEALLRKGLKEEAKDRYRTAAKDPAWKKPSLARFHSIR